MSAAPPLHLVACTKTKAATARPARELYASDWFRKARAYVEAQGAPWRILSAEHGLLDPAASVAPYQTTLLRMSAGDRRAWGARVLEQLQAAGLDGRPVVMLAGRLYREPLEAALAGRMTVPMQGLALGQQKAWLAAHTPGRPDDDR